MLNPSAKNSLRKIPRPECSGNRGELGPRPAGGAARCWGREGIPAGVFARQPRAPGRNRLLPFLTSPSLQGGTMLRRVRGLWGQRPLPGRGRPLPGSQPLAPSVSGSRTERARCGAAPRRQVRKLRGRRGAQSGPVGFQRPTAKMEKTAGAGTKRIHVVIVVSNNNVFHFVRRARASLGCVGPGC